MANLVLKLIMRMRSDMHTAIKSFPTKPCNELHWLFEKIVKNWYEGHLLTIVLETRNMYFI